MQVFHLVAQNDALSAQEMARDCRLLATASQRDSSSMKCISLVTMFFLPGTFVSSLMSIPLFDWTASSPHDMYRSSYWAPKLVMFVALTLPLMSITFGTWGFWCLVHQIRRRRNIALAQAQLHRSTFENETSALLLKRRSVSVQG